MKNRFGGNSKVNVLGEAKRIGGLLLNSCHSYVIPFCFNAFIWQMERVICFCKAKKNSVNLVHRQLIFNDSHERENMKKYKFLGD